MIDEIFPAGADGSIYHVQTSAPERPGRLPLTRKMLEEDPSGDLFGLSQNVGMGWAARGVTNPQFLILSTQGGLREPTGRPLALGYHTGHWELDSLVAKAAEELRGLNVIPFAAFVSDPCDGRTQGTTGMFDSLPYRNDAAIVLRRLIRSLPQRAGVIGIATCDKGLPAMMMALAGARDIPGIIVPGGVSLPPARGEDAGTVQTIGVRVSRGLLSVEEASVLGCAACATPGGGCQFLGTAATSQVVAEALGMALPHTALAPSGQAVWLQAAQRSAHAVVALAKSGRRTRDILTPSAVRNAMAVHAAFGGSSNLLLHLPAVAHAAGLERPTVDEWASVNQTVPRLVSVLPNGPVQHPTVRVFLAGGVPEVMVHLRDLGLLELDALSASGVSIDAILDEWTVSQRRQRFREALYQSDSVDPDDVILPPALAERRRLTSSISFVRGNLAPEGGVVKTAAIPISLLKPGGVYEKVGRAVVFTRETDAVAAVKQGGITAGDVVVLAGAGPIGTGMEETYQLTSALRYLPGGENIPLLTDARFSGVSSGPCIGHIGPEALAGGPIGKLVTGDRIRVFIDTARLEGTVDLVGDSEQSWTVEEGAARLAERAVRDDLGAVDELPDDTRLWAVLQNASGGVWGGCVYDIEAVASLLGAAQTAPQARHAGEA